MAAEKVILFVVNILNTKPFVAHKLAFMSHKEWIEKFFNISFTSS